MAENITMLDVTKVSENQLHSIISTQFTKLTELEDNVQNAVNLAVQAKEKAENAKVSAGLFKKKAAIEALQEAADGSANALITMAEAQKLSFEYQTKLTEITKYLFGLGVSNIAMNRSVVRELELRLKGASEEDISELAQQELRNVILQLKSQEDIMKKQEFLARKVKEQAGQIQEIDRQIDVMEATDEAQDEKIEENAEKIDKHDKALSTQQEKDAEHDRKFYEKDILDGKQNQKIEKNTELIIKHEQALNKLCLFKENAGKQICDMQSEVSTNKKELEYSIAELSRRITIVENALHKKTWKIAITVMAVASLILNVLEIVGII